MTSATPGKRLLTDFFKTKQSSKTTIPGKPIFNIPSRAVPTKKRKLISLGKEESSNYILDAGQKELGSKCCRTCGMVFDVSSPNEMMQHEKYHNRLTSFDYFKITANTLEAWKKKYIHYNMDTKLVFQVNINDEGSLKEKAITLIEDVVNVDLGFSPDISIWGKDGRCIVWMCVATEVSASFTFISCILITEPVDTAQWVDTDEVVSQPNILGINRVWTHPKCRRTGTAKELIRSVMRRYSSNIFAFSEPTESGKKLAASVDGSSDGRYLIYSIPK